MWKIEKSMKKKIEVIYMFVIVMVIFLVFFYGYRCSFVCYRYFLKYSFKWLNNILIYRSFRN